MHGGGGAVVLERTNYLLYCYVFQVLVQQGGVKAVLDAITLYASEPDFLVNAVRTLDNIVSADDEYAALVMEKGGKQAVERAKLAHSGHPDLVEAASSCLLAMNTMARMKDREGTKVNRGALFARLGGLVESQPVAASASLALKEPDGDPLAQHRNVLSTGQVIQEFIAGNSITKIFCVSPEWDALILRSADINKRQQGRFVSMRNLKEVRLEHKVDVVRSNSIQ